MLPEPAGHDETGARGRGPGAELQNTTKDLLRKGFVTQNIENYGGSHPVNLLFFPWSPV
ncbi:MAG: hypothetical protein K9J30_12035 [Bacteroidales bacterium]|nr:hypothetical protein [Bacteroidales bacterium]